MWALLKRFVGGGAPKRPAYPDHWETYTGQREGAPALILYNAGIGPALARLPARSCLTVVIPTKTVVANWLAAPEELAELSRLDDKVDRLIAGRSAYDLGRLSIAGQRRLYIAAGEDAAELGGEILRAAAELGYAATFRVDGSPDALGRAYADVLSPTGDERRGIGDQMVLRQLAEAEDDPTQVRQVDHWAYFTERSAAETFAAWATANGFEAIEVTETVGETEPFKVRSSHSGTMMPDDISGRTMAQHRKARELGGDYDGWETSVMR